MAQDYGTLFVGLTDRMNEDSWLWLDNSPYTPWMNVPQVYKWGENQPDNWVNPNDQAEDYDPNGQDCGIIHHMDYGYSLHDTSCSYITRGLCQQKLNTC